MHDRRDGVEEGEFALAGQPPNRLAQRRRRQRPGRNDDALPIIGRQPADFLPRDGDQRMGGKPRRYLSREAVAIDRERAARRQLMRVASRHDQRPRAAHLLMQQADGVVGPIVGTKRVRTDQLGQILGLVGLGHAHRTHFVDDDRHARRRDLPRGFRAGESPAYNMQWSFFQHHLIFCGQLRPMRDIGFSGRIIDFWNRVRGGARGTVCAL